VTAFSIPVYLGYPQTMDPQLDFRMIVQMVIILRRLG